MASNCKSCNERILWVKTESGKAMPLDVEPVPNGNVEVQRNVARYVTPEPDVSRYVSHFATCPAASTYRKRT